MNHKRRPMTGAYLDSSAISASWTCFLSANGEGKSRVMMSCSRTVGLYFLFLKYWQEKRDLRLNSNIMMLKTAARGEGFFRS